MSLSDATYGALLVDNKVGGVVADLTPWITRGQWDRKLDEMTQGQVTVIASTECCGFLERAAVTRQDLVILRNGEVVWQGPLVRITGRGETVRLEARDVVWWLTRRAVRFDTEATEENPVVATTYIRKVIEQAMEPDDRGVLDNLKIQTGTQTTSRSVQANTRDAYQELSDLASIVLDYTTIGKTLYIADDLFNFGIVGYLSDEDFRDGVEVVEDGQQFATKAIFRGSGTDNIQIYDASGGYYGLLEAFIRDGRTRDADTGAAAARNAIGDAIPPTLVAGEGGAILSPAAPVEANDLVAGALLRVTLRNMCRTVDQTQRIEAVDVNWDNELGLGEQFGLRLGPVDTTREGRFTSSGL